MLSWSSGTENPHQPGQHTGGAPSHLRGWKVPESRSAHACVQPRWGGHCCVLLPATQPGPKQRPVGVGTLHWVVIVPWAARAGQEAGMVKLLSPTYAVAFCPHNPQCPSPHVGSFTVLPAATKQTGCESPEAHSWEGQRWKLASLTHAPGQSSR